MSKIEVFMGLWKRLKWTKSQCWMCWLLTRDGGNRIKSPRKKSPRKNPFECRSAPTCWDYRFLNPNANEASYKPKQRSCRKTKLKLLLFFFFGWILSGGFYPGTLGKTCGDRWTKIIIISSNRYSFSIFIANKRWARNTNSFILINIYV